MWPYDHQFNSHLIKPSRPFPLITISLAAIDYSINAYLSNVSLTKRDLRIYIIIYLMQRFKIIFLLHQLSLFLRNDNCLNVLVSFLWFAFLDIIYAQSPQHLNVSDILNWLLNILNHIIHWKKIRTSVRFALISLVLHISGIHILCWTFQTSKRKYDVGFLSFIWYYLLK